MMKMFMIFGMMLFASLNGLPFFEDPRNVPSREDLLSLGGGIKFGWLFDGGNYLKMNVEIPTVYTWFAVGFHEMPYTRSVSENMALIYIKENRDYKTKMYLKSMTFDNEGNVQRSKQNTYTKISSKISTYMYKMSIERDLGDLPYNDPVKFLWAYGRGSVVDIIPIFNSKLNHAVVTLNDPNSLKLLPSTQPSTMLFITNEANIESGSYNELKVTDVPSTTERIRDVFNNTQIPTSQISNESDSKKGESQPDMQGVSSVDPTLTTLCPTKKCNCPNVHPWYEDITNSLYMAIIGAAALFTGLLVLCIACCCARKKSGIPKVRKHKVAFYKVNDFDSDADEEEIEFLREDKEKPAH